MKLNNEVILAIASVSRLYVSYKVDSSISTKVEILAADTEQSYAFTEQVMRKLRLAKLVESVKGPGGGYRIIKDKINLLDVVEALGLPITKSHNTPFFSESKALEIDNAISKALMSIDLSEEVLDMSDIMHEAQEDSQVH